MVIEHFQGMPDPLREHRRILAGRLKLVMEGLESPGDLDGVLIRQRNPFAGQPTAQGIPSGAGLALGNLRAG
jgi:hypothetical protein